MSLLKTWSDLYELHEETNRGGLVKKLYKGQPLKVSWIYYATIIVAIALTILIFNFSAQNPSVLLLAVFEIAAIYAWINFLIENNNKELITANNLKKHGFYQRQKHISYLLFAEKLNQSNIIKKDDVDLLVSWERIRNEKHNIFSFFHAPVVIIVLTMTAGVLTEYFKVQIESEKLLLKAFLFLIFFGLFFVWSFSDTMQTNKKINNEICQYLQWWKIDKIT